MSVLGRVVRKGTERIWLEALSGSDCLGDEAESCLDGLGCLNGMPGAG